tara:strand:- start:33 stop:407 length:375 start_codon:yes stop_codon:yes gene_type:complete
MAAYGFYAAHLRFIAAKTDASEPEVAAMVTELSRIADAVEVGADITVPSDKLRVTARGLAGVSGFLQEQILPEVVAAGNAAGESQVRWVIDTSMRLMTKLTTRAEMGGSDAPLTLSLPAPPLID